MVALYIISRHGHDLLDTVFHMGQDLAQEIPNAIHNLYSREQVLEYGRALLNTPEGRERVINAMHNICRMRTSIGG